MEINITDYARLFALRAACLQTPEQNLAMLRACFGKGPPQISQDREFPPADTVNGITISCLICGGQQSFLIGPRLRVLCGEPN